MTRDSLEQISPTFLRALRLILFHNERDYTHHPPALFTAMENIPRETNPPRGSPTQRAARLRPSRDISKDPKDSIYLVKMARYRTRGKSSRDRAIR